MKIIYMQISGILFSIFFSFLANAGELVSWTGIVSEEGGYHSTEHEFRHSLEFTRQNDGDNFAIINSKELEALHIEKERNLLVEIEAEKTSRFLFWGGNLVVKSFKVLEELEQIPHRAYKSPSSAMHISEKR